MKNTTTTAANPTYCDTCWSGKPASSYIVRHWTRDRGTRMNLCVDCVAKAQDEGSSVKAAK